MGLTVTQAVIDNFNAFRVIVAIIIVGALVYKNQKFLNQESLIALYHAINFGALQGWASEMSEKQATAMKEHNFKIVVAESLDIDRKVDERLKIVDEEQDLASKKRD